MTSVVRRKPGKGACDFGIAPLGSFPRKLHALLDTAEENGYADIICWQPEGRSFKVLQPAKFVAEILPSCSKQTKYKSFQRQLNIYGFYRIHQGINRGGYGHRLFIRGMPELAKRVSRESSKNKADTTPAPPPGSLMQPPRKTTSSSSPSQPPSPISYYSNYEPYPSQYYSSPPRPSRCSGESRAYLSGSPSRTSGVPNSSPSSRLIAKEESVEAGPPSLQFAHTAPRAKHHTHRISFDDDAPYYGAGTKGSDSSSGLDDNSVPCGDEHSRRLVRPNLPAMGSSDVLASKMFHPVALSADFLQPNTKNASFVEVFGADMNNERNLLKTDHQELRPSEPTRHYGEEPRDAGEDRQADRSFSADYKNSSDTMYDGNLSAGGGYSTDEEELFKFLNEEMPPWQPAATTAVVEPSISDTSYEEANAILSTSSDANTVPPPTFPFKLHQMLEEATLDGGKWLGVVSWLEDGTAFKVHQVDTVVKDILPIYFDQTKYESFRRQLNLYCFTRVSRGPKRGMYYHPNFRQGDRSLCAQIARTKSPSDTK